MGADLTIVGIEDENKGYFRDSYNCTNVLNRLGISWWKDVVPLLDEGILKGDKLLQFRDQVKQAKLKPLTNKEAGEKLIVFGKGKDNTLEGWNSYFRKKHRRLIKFLNLAIKQGGVHCSL